MKILYYLTFRIYRFFKDTRREKDIPLFRSSVVVTILVWFNLFAIMSILDIINVIDFSKIFPNKYYVLIPGVILWSIIYFGIIKPKKFLNYNFKKSKKGGFAVVTYVVFTAFFFIIVANINRAKIVQENLKNPIGTEKMQEKRPSLEGKIRKWFNERF